jgi:hypothetical protein
MKKEDKEKLPEQIESGSESPFKRFEKLAKKVITTPKSTKKQTK